MGEPIDPPPNPPATGSDGEVTPTEEPTLTLLDRATIDTNGQSVGTDDASDAGASHVSISGGMAAATIADTDRQCERHQMEQTLADKKLISIYSHTIQCNPRTHQHAGIEDDEQGQFVYCLVLSYDHQKYEVPQGALGK